MRQLASDILQLVRSAGSKLAGHWPTLIALTLGAFTVKLAALKLAVLAGSVAWVLGVFIYTFTAAGMLAAFMLMFRMMLPSRPWPPFTTVLAPFLLIFLATNHFDGYVISPALERNVTMDVAAASLLTGAILLRWLLPLWTVVNTQRWFTWVKLGLDICWISLAALTISSHPAWNWLADVTKPAAWALTAVFAVVIVPLAWLSVGALSLGWRPADLPAVARRAGLPITLAMCLVLFLFQYVPLLMWQIERLILGPQDLETFWVPVSGIAGAANSAVGALLMVCLVAAFLTRSVGQETGIGGQSGLLDDANSNRFGVGRRDEIDDHLIDA